MTIDVQPGDTFTIAPHGAVFQYRDECGRILGGKNFDFECTRSQHERQITLAQFKTVVELAGHTVTEITPEPEPVLVTHGIVNNKKPGLVLLCGTKQGCEDWLGESGDEAFSVRPITFAAATKGQA